MKVSATHFEILSHNFDAGLAEITTDRLVSELIARGANCETIDYGSLCTLQHIAGPKVVLMIDVNDEEESE